MLALVPLFAACAPSDNDVVVQKPNILVTPEVLDFGDVVELYSGSSSVEVLNGGRGELKISNITLSGDDADAFELGDWQPTLALNESFPLEIGFYPEDPLPYSAVLTILSNDEDTPEQTVTLTGQGVVSPTPDIDCDALSLDFGTVTAGDYDSKWVTCENIGDDDLVIDDLTSEGSGDFEVVSDPSGTTVGPGESFQVIVMYFASEAGASGQLTLSSNDPDEPEVDVLLVGNGGSNDEYPIAVLDCPTTVEPRTTVQVDGSASYDPNGYDNPLEFFWSAEGPHGELECLEVDETVVLELDLAGAYEVQLQVMNTNDLMSAPSTCTIQAIPEEQLHVELMWEDTNDMDLHLLPSGGELFIEPYDCNFCNPNPDWGTAGDSSDDPTLDLDAYSDPPGVENINIDQPADDTYSVKVHYFEDSGAGDVTATVNIYLYGVLEASYSRVLSRNDVWDVAQIVWPDGYVVEESTDLYNPEIRTCDDGVE